MSEWKPEGPEVIVERQNEIRGALYPKHGTAGLQMLGTGGDVIAEVWISATAIPEIIEWLEFARGRLGSVD